ncbi:hypothetical protein K474DRAFT_1196426 [Panus rudis PR-1116 ss-1]|nr:hypothetical protein K474DRAFT_1196426 [Panus rudis PR-1116 ss-1]
MHVVHACSPSYLPGIAHVGRALSDSSPCFPSMCPCAGHNHHSKSTKLRQSNMSSECGREPSNSEGLGTPAQSTTSTADDACQPRPRPWVKPKSVQIPTVVPYHGRTRIKAHLAPLSELDTDTILTALPGRHDNPGILDKVAVQCIFTAQIHKAILALPDITQPVPQDDVPAYAIRVDRKRGLGMYATRDLDIGDFIVAERPLLLYPMGVPFRGPILTDAVNRMTNDRRDAYCALRNVNGYTGSFLSGIRDTNSLGVDGIPGYPYHIGAVCDVISRVNHRYALSICISGVQVPHHFLSYSCTPNSHWTFRVESFAIEVRAKAAIKKGDQIFAPYTFLDEPRSERRKILLKGYKFLCDCPSCSLPDSDSRVSDARRKRILQLTHEEMRRDGIKILKWLASPNTPDLQLIDECKDVINLMDTERIWPAAVSSAILQRIVQAYCAIEDAENASYWARRASKYFLADNLGDDAGWSLVAENPEATDWWGLRKEARRVQQQLFTGHQ